MDEKTLKKLVDHLIIQKESELVEFKKDHIAPKDLGKLISSLSNSATFLDKECGYIVFGVCDEFPHKIVGTSYKPKEKKIGNQLLESWLQQRLYPRINFSIYEFVDDGNDMVVFRVSASTERPVAFDHIEYIRVGSVIWKLRDQQGRERSVWAKLQYTNFESGIARSNLSVSDTLDLLECQKFLSLLGIPIPSETKSFVEHMTQRNLVRKGVEGRYDITNMGAILFAKDITKFSSIKGKTIRVIVYKGSNNLHAIKESEFSLGYAVCFEDLVSYINDQLPSSEDISGVLRKEQKMYPDIAIREFLVNAFIHQDFSLMDGIGPMVEILKIGLRLQIQESH